MFPLQRQSQPHAQDPVSKVSLHELCTEDDTAHTVLASFINGPANESLLTSHAHSYTQHSDATVPPSSIGKFSPKIHRSLADPRHRKASGTPRFSISETIKEITVHKRWNNSTTRFIERMMMARLKNRTARAVSRWRDAQQQPITRHTAVKLQDARSLPCTCKGRKCQPAKSDTAHGSHMYNCELIYKWHEHGTRITHAQRRENLCKPHWSSAPDWPAVTSSTTVQPTPAQAPDQTQNLAHPLLPWAILQPQSITSSLTKARVRVKWPERLTVESLLSDPALDSPPKLKGVTVINSPSPIIRATYSVTPENRQQTRLASVDKWQAVSEEMVTYPLPSTLTKLASEAAEDLASRWQFKVTHR